MSLPTQPQDRSEYITELPAAVQPGKQYFIDQSLFGAGAQPQDPRDEAELEQLAIVAFPNDREARRQYREKIQAYTAREIAKARRSGYTEALKDVPEVRAKKLAAFTEEYAAEGKAIAAQALAKLAPIDPKFYMSYLETTPKEIKE